MARNPLTVRGVTMNIQAIHPKQALQDATDAAQLEAFAHQLATGEEETVPAAVVNALLEGANPVKVWREHRALTQDVLAAQARPLQPVTGPKLAEPVKVDRDASSAAQAQTTLPAPLPTDASQRPRPPAISSGTPRPMSPWERTVWRS